MRLPKKYSRVWMRFQNDWVPGTFLRTRFYNEKWLVVTPQEWTYRTLRICAVNRNLNNPTSNVSSASVTQLTPRRGYVKSALETTTLQKPQLLTLREKN